MTSPVYIVKIPTETYPVWLTFADCALRGYAIEFHSLIDSATEFARRVDAQAALDLCGFRGEVLEVTPGGRYGRPYR